MRVYFVTAGRKDEIKVIKEVKPKNLLLSYHYWKNKSLESFIEEIGYKPRILLDSGAWSAYTSGKTINIDDYIKYIKKNKAHIWHYIALDVIGDSGRTYTQYLQMKSKGLDPIPVFHYMNNEKILVRYIEHHGAVDIALGGTVPIKNKAEVAEWVKMISWLYPAKYHLLGSSSRKIIDHCDIDSCDSSTWIVGSAMGKPKHIPGRDREAKLKRATYNMRRDEETYERLNKQLRKEEKRKKAIPRNIIEWGSCSGKR